jgi:dethiobiotin synthetase
MKELFITATDTDAGKTFVSCAIIAALTERNQKTVAAFKPVSAGCELINGHLVNDDAKWLTHYANVKQSLGNVNPIAFLEPIAPHIAAKKNSQVLTVNKLSQHYSDITARKADITLVEGAGGWRLPLSISHINSEENQFLADFVKAHALEVVLVVNMKLGCLNHALLTYEAIKADGLNCIAWVANCASAQKMSNLADNISELEQLFPMPKIAQLDYIDDNITNSQGEGQVLTFTDKVAIAANQVDVTVLL